MTLKLKPSQLCKMLPLPANAKEQTVACDMGLISGFFKKMPKKGRPKKNSIFMNSLPPNKKKKGKNKNVDPPTTNIDPTVNPLLPSQSQAAAVQRAHPPSKATKT